MILRGQIWWADLDDPKASEPGYRRPVLIIQSNEFNRSRINTVIAVALTSDLRLAEAPGNVHLSAKKSGLQTSGDRPSGCLAGGLPKDSVANVSQLLTLDKAFLLRKAGELEEESMQAVEDGIRLILSL